MRGHEQAHTRVTARSAPRPGAAVPQLSSPGAPARPPLLPAALPADLRTGAGSACNARPRQKRSFSQGRQRDPTCCHITAAGLHRAALPRRRPLAGGGTGHPRLGLPRAVPLQPRAAPRPSSGSPPGSSSRRKHGVPVPEGRGCSSFPCPGQRRRPCVRVCPRVCVCVPACVPACPRVCAVPARRACMCGPATCGVCGVCGERSGPGPTCGAPPTPPPPLRARLAGFSPVLPEGIIGGKCQLRRSIAMCLSPPPALTACFSFGSVSLPPFRGLRLLEVRDLQIRAPTESGGGGITPINTKHAPAGQNRDGNLTSFLSNDRALQTFLVKWLAPQNCLKW
ncbi:translation initiation factor IF-2-like [Catharus ustulatus]|uniref:translation initiation factor IF-2-like n=1 Tax=Catharus ustulatus TaxID=91951 RepID=UPI00140A90DB|nr:translation initiation factor IF-2-like [Catharus ustulatus]